MFNTLNDLLTTLTAEKEELNLRSQSSLSNTRSPIINVPVPTLSNFCKEKLLDYQRDHVLNLIDIIKKKGVALDASDTGVGKTYIAAAICHELGLRPIIVCPKSLLFSWKSILDIFNVDAYDIVNYETLRNGLSYTNGSYNERKSAQYLQKVGATPLHPLTTYQWNLASNTILIFDEAQRCKEPESDNGKLLLSTSQAIKSKIPLLLLSATICEKVTDMRVPFCLFGLITKPQVFTRYEKTLLTKYPIRYFNKRELTKEQIRSLRIREEIKPFSSRIRIRDLGDICPFNHFCAQQFVLESSDKIAAAYKRINRLLKKMRYQEESSSISIHQKDHHHHLARIQKLRQKIELCKSPIFIEQTRMYLEQGKSVIIFVNYLATMQIFVDELQIRCTIHGSQTIKERQEAIDLFQTNKEKLIVCQIRAGGSGISLHDLDGNYPRVTLINYPDRASDLIQALGRAVRAGCRSPVLQRVLLAANVEFEQHLASNINRKLANISTINDGDLNGLINYEQ